MAGLKAIHQETTSNISEKQRATNRVLSDIDLKNNEYIGIGFLPFLLC